MEYQQYDIKVERCHVDIIDKKVTYFPSREDSYDRLLEEKHQFVSGAESVEDTAVKALLIEKMLLCFKQLAPEEQELTQKLFFKGKSEQEYGKLIGISRKE
ncbi:hypothetical protein [Anaerocolumna jejuensis]|uniref:hypothetical protein n=1 Tax=Anaerocolumna jejuensis TaxID=259063 RepID=UPI003F7C8219